MPDVVSFGRGDEGAEFTGVGDLSSGVDEDAPPVPRRRWRSFAAGLLVGVVACVAIGAAFASGGGLTLRMPGFLGGPSAHTHDPIVFPDRLGAMSKEPADDASASVTPKGGSAPFASGTAQYSTGSRDEAVGVEAYRQRVSPFPPLLPSDAGTPIYEVQRVRDTACIVLLHDNSGAAEPDPAAPPVTLFCQRTSDTLTVTVSNMSSNRIGVAPEKLAAHVDEVWIAIKRG